MINYLVKVFLYLGLKDARKSVHIEYRLQRRLDALYDRVMVGPVNLPPSPTAGDLATQVAPHWRRGHYRQQAHGPARSEAERRGAAAEGVRADRRQRQGMIANSSSDSSRIPDGT